MKLFLVVFCLTLAGYTVKSAMATTSAKATVQKAADRLQMVERSLN